MQGILKENSNMVDEVRIKARDLRREFTFKGLE